MLTLHLEPNSKNFGGILLGEGYEVGKQVTLKPDFFQRAMQLEDLQ